MRQDCGARTPQAHLDLSPCAERHVPAKTLPRSHARSTVGSLAVRKKAVHATALLRSHAVTTVGSRSVRKQEDMFMHKDCAAFSRCEHTWISLRAQRNMFSIEKTAALSRRTWISLLEQARRQVHATDCCARTPQAHLDLSPRAQRHVPAKQLLRSHEAGILGSLSVRKRHVPSKRLLRSRAALQDK